MSAKKQNSLLLKVLLSIIAFAAVGCSNSVTELNVNEANLDNSMSAEVQIAETSLIEPTEIVIGYYGNISSKLLRSFNDSQSEYVLTGVDYSQDGSVPLDTAVARLNSELAAGEGPDIIYTYRFRLDDVFYGEQGWFEDLYPYIDEDSDLNRDDFVPSLFQAVESNGHLYTTLPCFSVATVIAPESLLPYGKQFSFAYMEELINTYGAETILGGISKTIFFENCLSVCLSDLVDVDSGAVYFDSDYFRELLSFCASLLEKKTENYMAFLIPGKTSDAVMAAMQMLKAEHGEHFAEVFKTITVDNGAEFADFAQCESWGTKVYFAHPYTSWERPQNERHNGLFRAFVPKGASMQNYSAEYILAAADELNSRPRKKLGYATPEELFDAFLDRVYSVGSKPA